MEILPGALHTLHKFSRLAFLVPDSCPTYLEDAIQLISQEKDREIQMIRSNKPLRIPRLLLMGIEPFSGFVHPQDLFTLRQEFLPHVTALNNSNSRYLYISRSKTSKRTLGNERELEIRLAAKGVEILFAENLSLSEQIQLFSSARIVIAPHGAGLSNLVWSQPGAKVLEIFPAEMFNDCYARLAMNLGLEYRYVSCDFSPDSAGLIPIDSVIELLEDMQ
jgi:capsular polysaccharide biosynthesis protein